MKRLALCFTLLGFAAAGCNQPATGGHAFGDDVAFLKKSCDVILLSDSAGQAQVALSAKLQGRVMTSTAGGPGGTSYGWINRDQFARPLDAHFNPFGGEERFWMGPEGGQFSVYFAKGAAFDLAHWYVPKAIDTQSWEVASKAATSATFHRAFQLTNYSGTKFDVDATREIRMLPPDQAWKRLGVAANPAVKMVAFESDNRVTNTGQAAWKKDSGLLSIWILCSFTPSPTTTIVVPIKPGPESELGKKVVDDYFGKVPAERLIQKDKVVFFSADGKCRSKIGFGPKRTTGILGSYDAQNKVLTLAQFTVPEGATEYVNSAWKIQDNPFAGDAANSYNDGPAAPGKKPMGPFYEIESSSPALALEPGKTAEHVHRTIHLQGEEKDLDPIARATLGVGLDEIKKAFAK
jgi:hypothetical protein